MAAWGMGWRSTPCIARGLAGRPPHRCTLNACPSACVFPLPSLPCQWFVASLAPLRPRSARLHRCYSPGVGLSRAVHLCWSRCEGDVAVRHELIQTVWASVSELCCVCVESSMCHDCVSIDALACDAPEPAPLRSECFRVRFSLPPSFARAASLRFSAKVLAGPTLSNCVFYGAGTLSSKSTPQDPQDDDDTASFGTSSTFDEASGVGQRKHRSLRALHVLATRACHLRLLGLLTQCVHHVCPPF